VQVDAALYGFYGRDSINLETTRSSLDFSSENNDHSYNGHIGGAAFTRNDQMALGVAASIVMQKSHIEYAFYTPFESNTHFFRAGAFAEYFGGDSFTLGASGHYFTGGTPSFNFQNDATMSGFEGTAYLKFYPSENFALSIQGDGVRGKADADYYHDDISGYAATVEAEYKFANTPLSLSVGGRWAHRESEGEYYLSTIEDKQIFASAKFDFGGAKNTSLLMRDRTGTYDNTSTLFEKLPDFFSSDGRAYENEFHPYPDIK
jgi:hypothetical protein